MERKYRMIRLGAGDYLLPDNDGQRLWRLSRYEETGSLRVEKDGGPEGVVGFFWAVDRFVGDFANIDPMDPDQWENYEFLLPTRNAAIEAALS